jgi:prophage antirepressor-like protein
MEENNELQVFKFDEKDVRIIDKDGQPWWILSDICKILKLKSAPMVSERLDEDEKNTISLNYSIPGNPNRTIINESGLYSVILRSDKPDAKRFRKWITSEVLPSIRKTGTYSINTPKTFAEALQLAADQQKEIEKKNTQLQIAAPKVDFFDQVTSSKDAIEMKEVAKVLNIKNMGRNNLFEFLRNQNILMGNNTPYQHYIDCGYFRVIEQKYEVEGEIHINLKTIVYQKGLDFIRQLILEKTGDK